MRQYLNRDETRLRRKKAKIVSGTFTYGLLLFEVAYEGDLIGYYNAKVSEDGKTIVDGKGLSNKGTESFWTAVRQ